MAMKLLGYLLLLSSMFAVGLGLGAWQRGVFSASLPDIAAIMAPACRSSDPASDEPTSSRQRRMAVPPSG